MLEEEKTFSVHALRQDASIAFRRRTGFHVIIIFSLLDLWVLSYRNHNVFIFTDIFLKISHNI